ncbi:hypothetical protein QBC35DRAFT_516304 [Podospora australis]|uniref:BZIP domain-containing protein n=1 Tax=Podospora australis TaxID=1536484 RepID=A0AAN7AHY3_9PEZI|nr:hypothetical protein QBC35DRAFT_516304 [Podospora australis]
MNNRIEVPTPTTSTRSLQKDYRVQITTDGVTGWDALCGCTNLESCQEWVLQPQQEQHAFVLPSSSSNLRYGGCEQQQHQLLSFDLDPSSSLFWDGTFDNLPGTTSTSSTLHPNTPFYTPELTNFAFSSLSGLDPNVISFADIDISPNISDLPTPFTTITPCTPPDTQSSASSSISSPISTSTSAPPTLVVPGLQLPPSSKPVVAKKGRPGRKRARSVTPEDEADPDVIEKRQRNNLAAKKYRQKKVDRIDELEKEVSDVKKERDDLKVELARREAEVEMLREMLKLARN